MFREVLAAAAAVAVLVGCSGGPDPSAAAAPSGSDTAIAAVRAEYPSYEAAPDEQLRALLQSICEIFDAGGRWLDALKPLTEAGKAGREAGFLVATSVVAMCPEYRDLLPN
jgi:hypothetical protein